MLRASTNNKCNKLFPLGETNDELTVSQELITPSADEMKSRSNSFEEAIVITSNDPCFEEVTVTFQVDLIKMINIYFN